MTESEAIVTRLDGEHLWLDASGGCSSCESSGGCGLSDGHGKRPQRVRNTVGARVGDSVILSVPDGAVLKATLWSYLMPLGLTIAGAASGQAFGGEAGAVAGALGGLTVGWGALRIVSTRLMSGREPLVTMRLKEVVVHLHRNQLS